MTARPSDDTTRSAAIRRNAEQWRRRGRDADIVELVGLIREAARRVGHESERVITGHGLTRGLFDVLTALYRHGGDTGLTQMELSRAMLITPAGMKKRVSALTTSGLIARTPDGTDLRKFHLVLTPDGERLLEEVLDQVFLAETSALAGLTRAQRPELRALLTMIVDRPH